MKQGPGDSYGPTYPFVARSPLGLIVLFTAYGKGVVLHAGSTGNVVGDVHSNWAHSNFSPIPRGEEVIITND